MFLARLVIVYILPMKEKIIKKSTSFFFLIFIIFLVSTFIAWKITQSVVETEVRQNFNQEVQIAKHWTQDRLNLYLPIFLGIRIFFETSDNVTANEWLSYIQRIKLLDKYSGISSISYIERIRDEDKDIIVSQLRSDNSLWHSYSSFTIHPQNKKKEYYVIKYVEPFSGNEDILGFDLSSDQKQLEILNNVRDEDPTSKGRVTLITTAKKGFSIILPVYQKGPVPVTIEERRKALKGFIKAEFLGDKLFQDIFSLVDSINLNFEIYTGSPSKENLLYNQDPIHSILKPDYKPKIKTSDTFQFDNQTWYLVATTKPDFKLTASQEKLPLIVLGSGLVFSFILLGIYLYMLKHETFKDYKNKNN